MSKRVRLTNGDDVTEYIEIESGDFCTRAYDWRAFDPYVVNDSEKIRVVQAGDEARTKYPKKSDFIKSLSPEAKMKAQARAFRVLVDELKKFESDQAMHLLHLVHDIADEESDEYNEYTYALPPCPPLCDAVLDLLKEVEVTENLITNIENVMTLPHIL
jgi:hypothetical protein